MHVQPVKYLTNHLTGLFLFTETQTQFIQRIEEEHTHTQVLDNLQMQTLRSLGTSVYKSGTVKKFWMVTNLVNRWATLHPTC